MSASSLEVSAEIITAEQVETRLESLELRDEMTNESTERRCAL